MNISTSCVISVRRRRRTFAAPFRNQLPMIYANIHTTYRRRQRIHAIHWSNRTIAYPCCAGYVRQRDWPHISCHFRSCFVDRPPDGPGRNTTGQHNLYRARPPVVQAQAHSNTSNQRIWRVVSVCDVTGCRRSDQLFHFEMPFIPLVQHVYRTGGQKVPAVHVRYGGRSWLIFVLSGGMIWCL